MLNFKSSTDLDSRHFCEEKTVLSIRKK